MLEKRINAKGKKAVGIVYVLFLFLGLCFTAPSWGQDKNIPSFDVRKKISLNDLAQYLGVKEDKKTVQTAIQAYEEYGIFKSQIDPAFSKGDYNKVLVMLGQIDATKWRTDVVKWQSGIYSEELREIYSEKLHRLDTNLIKENMVEEWLRNRSVYITALQDAKKDVEEKALAEKKAEEGRIFAEKKAEEERIAAEKKAEEERAAVIVAANAKGVTAADFEYDATRDGTGVTIKSYKGIATVVKIPAVIEKFPVREIADGAFQGNIELTSVTIPDSVTSIGDNIFVNCINLKTVNLPKNLKNISNSAFAGCIKLENITLPANLQVINDYAFKNCNALKTISLPDSITHIRTGAFMDCTSLSGSLVLPKNLERLGGFNDLSYTFQGCTSITSVTFQSKDLVILSGAFSGCNALTTLIINANIVFSDSFNNCPITTVTIAPGVTRISGAKNIPQDKLSLATKAALNKLDHY